MVDWATFRWVLEIFINPDGSLGYFTDKLVLVVGIDKFGEEQPPVILHFFTKDLKITVSTPLYSDLRLTDLHQ